MQTVKMLSFNSKKKSLDGRQSNIAMQQLTSQDMPSTSGTDPRHENYEYAKYSYTNPAYDSSDDDMVLSPTKLPVLPEKPTQKYTCGTVKLDELTTVSGRLTQKSLKPPLFNGCRLYCCERSSADCCGPNYGAPPGSGPVKQGVFKFFNKKPKKYKVTRV
jgi:hypothetical protein